MTTESTMQDSRGNAVPTRYVPKYKKQRDRLVKKHIRKAKKLSQQLLKVKNELMIDVNNFIGQMCDEDHKIGGKKGNITLTSFDGNQRITIAQSETIAFDEQLQVAKEKIADWITAKTSGVHTDLQKLIDDAFYADKGNIRTARVLSLLRLDIRDHQWIEAMELIRQSVTVASTKAYIRFYLRETTAEDFTYLPLDISNV